MTKIKIKPKSTPRVVDIESIKREERVEREQQQDYCDEITKLRSEMEIMKMEMAEMKQYFRLIQNKEERRISCDSQVEMRTGRLGEEQLQNSSDFSEWMNELEMTYEDLENLFQSKDIIDWACHFIISDLNKKKKIPYPICSIKGSKNEILVYDSKRWRKISDNELFTKLTDKLFKKILKIFTQWKNDNYNRILTSEQFATMYHSNYARILSFNENFSKLKLKLFNTLDSLDYMWMDSGK
jgi:hypothetical protein